MRFHLELDLDLPRARVIELFLDPNNLAKWQPDLISVEPIDGDDSREVGARTRQIHRSGKREVEMIETITVYDYPERFSAIYEADKIWNLIENQFIEVSADRTRWLIDAEFRCSGMIGVIGFFLPSIFRNQTSKFMHQFKDFAEASAG